MPRTPIVDSTGRLKDKHMPTRLLPAGLDGKYPRKVKLKTLWNPYGPVVPAGEITTDVYETNVTGSLYDGGFAFVQWDRPELDWASTVIRADPSNAANGGVPSNTPRTTLGPVIDFEFVTDSRTVGFFQGMFPDFDSQVYVSDEQGVMRPVAARPKMGNPFAGAASPQLTSAAIRTIQFATKRPRRIRYVAAFQIFYNVLVDGRCTVARPPSREVIVSLSDSFREQSGMKNANASSPPVYSAESYHTAAISDHHAARMGWKVVRMGLGGTGWFNNAASQDGGSNGPIGPGGSVNFMHDAMVAKIKALGKNTIRLIHINGTINDDLLNTTKAGMKARINEGLNKISSWDSGIRFVITGPEPYDNSAGVPQARLNNRDAMKEVAAERSDVIGFIDPLGGITTPGTLPVSAINAFYTGTGSEQVPQSSGTQSLYTGRDAIHYNYAGGVNYATRELNEMGEFYIDAVREVVS